MMNRQKAMHLLRAIATISGENTLVLVGSATVLFRAKHIPAAMFNTNEIDVYAPDAADPDMFSDLIDGTIGRGSQFDRTYNYFGDGVSPNTASMPSDWRDRARPEPDIAPAGVEVIVPDINDIALSNMAAWRDKDRDWLKAGVQSLILDPGAMAARLHLMPAASHLEELSRRMVIVAGYSSP